MKIALVHELLTMKGGAERVLRILADMFPDAPIYTLLYDEPKLSDWFPKERVRPSHPQRTARFFGFNHHLYLPLFPKAVEAWDFSDYDLVISTSSAFVHGIITNGKPLHLCYVHSPARYLWDRTHDVQEQAGHGFLGALKRLYLSYMFSKLRVWDCEVAPRPDRLLAASKEVQRRIELYWDRTSTVVYPPLDDVFFTEPLRNENTKNTTSPFLIVSSLVRYKRIDIAIDACNRLGLPLLIVGEGPDHTRLRKLAGPTITFVGRKTEAELRTLYTSARATLFPGEEDFGLVPLESMACGTPVIAYRKGGALETILEGETGAFFDEPTPESLLNTIAAFDDKKYSNQTCRLRAEEFRRSVFEQKFYSEVDAFLHSHNLKR